MLPETSPPLGSLPDPLSKVELSELDWPAGDGSLGVGRFGGRVGVPWATAHVPPTVCCALLLMDTPCSPDSNEFSRLVAGEYLSFFDFSGLTLDRALRSVGLGPGNSHRWSRMHIWILMPALSQTCCATLGQSLDPSGEALGRRHQSSSHECQLYGGH